MNDTNGNGLNGLIYLAIIAFMFGGGNFGFGGNNNSNALQNDINRGFDNQNLQAQTRDILTAVNSGTAQSVAATNQTFHDTLASTQNLYNELARDIAAVQVGQANALANQNGCCCDIKQLIQQTSAATDAQIAQAKYEAAMQMAQMEARLDSKMDANTIQNLRDKVSALELAQATNGMLRFPNSWTYGAGFFPPVYGGCCGNNANI